MSYVISENDVLIEGKNFEGSRVKFRNCRFANTAGSGKKAGQAIALYLDGDDIVLEDCVPEGHQDTLFLAPLPPHAYEKDGFLGPGQFTPRTRRGSVVFEEVDSYGSGAQDAAGPDYVRYTITAEEERRGKYGEKDGYQYGDTIGHENGAQRDGCTERRRNL